MSNMALPALDGSGGSVPRLNRPLIGDAGSAPTPVSTPANGTDSEAGAGTESSASTDTDTVTAGDSGTAEEAGASNVTGSPDASESRFNPEDVSYISPEAEESGLFGEDANAVRFNVSAWDGADGSPTDSIHTALTAAGYDDAAIYTPDANGQTLIDRVVEANNGLGNEDNQITDPDVLQEGQELYIPTEKSAEELGLESPQGEEAAETGEGDTESATPTREELDEEKTHLENLNGSAELLGGDDNLVGREELAEYGAMATENRDQALDQLRQANPDLEDSELNERLDGIIGAANYFGQSENFARLDNADTGEGTSSELDGLYGAGDLNQRTETVSQAWANTVLQDNAGVTDVLPGGDGSQAEADGLTGTSDIYNLALGNGRFDEKQLVAQLGEEGAADLVEAAQVYRSDTSLIPGLDVANDSSGNHDRLFGTGDLQAQLERILGR